MITGCSVSRGACIIARMFAADRVNRHCTCSFAQFRHADPVKCINALIIVQPVERNRQIPRRRHTGYGN